MSWFVVRGRRAVVLTLALVSLASGALAQEDSAATPPGVLGEMVSERDAGNTEAQAVQRRIDETADETSELLAKYRTTLKQIDAIDLYNSQMQDMIAAQEREIASLADQVDRVEEVSRSVTPLMLRMISAIEKFVELDIPFLIEERTKRIETLRETMKRADVKTSEKFRQTMDAYQTEAEYGRTIEAYQGPIVVDGKESTVNFLRFGRIALVYLSIDESQGGVWNQQTRQWDPLDSSLYSSVAAGLKIARRQAAPDMITIPLPAARDARGNG